MNFRASSLNIEFIKFLGVGGFAALVNFTSRIFLSLAFNYVAAIIVAYLLGMMTAYLLCRLWVFSPKKNSNLQQMMFFVLVNLFAVAQTIIVSLILVRYGFFWITDLAMREACAHFIGVCVPVFTSYFGHKYITFQ